MFVEIRSPESRNNTRREYLLLSGVLAIMLVASNSLAQPANSEDLTFEVISIKPTGPTDNRVMMGFLPGGAFRATGVTAKMLIQEAFDVRDYQVSGPAWIGRDTFAIDAKPPDQERRPKPILNLTLSTDGSDESDAAARLRSLLVQRFALKDHIETRDIQTFSLTLDHGRSKLQEATNTRDASQRGLAMGRTQLTGTAVSMRTLALELSRRLGRPVLNQTGLTGVYNFKLEWGLDLDAQGGDTLGDAPAISGPSIFTAIRDQLGLRLQSRKGPVKIIVIDDIQKPLHN